LFKTLFAKLAAAKVALAVTAAVVATGGTTVVAVAVSHASTHAQEGLSIAAQHRPATGESSDSAEPSEAQPSTHGSPPSGVPNPSLVGLCHAYQAGAGSHQTRVLHNPAFTVLVNAAGGADNLAVYCARLIGAEPSHPAGRPNSVSSHSHPAGRPSSVPSHPHPSGAPSPIPPRSRPSRAPSPVPSHSHP
jgi:hypothetical protein